MLSPVKHIHFCIMSLSSEETAFSFNFHHVQLLKYYSFLAARQKYAIQPVTPPHLAPFKYVGENKSYHFYLKFTAFGLIISLPAAWKTVHALGPWDRPVAAWAPPMHPASRKHLSPASSWLAPSPVASRSAPPALSPHPGTYGSVSITSQLSSPSARWPPLSGAPADAVTTYKCAALPQHHSYRSDPSKTRKDKKIHVFSPLLKQRKQHYQQRVRKYYIGPCFRWRRLVKSWQTLFPTRILVRHQLNTLYWVMLRKWQYHYLHGDHVRPRNASVPLILRNRPQTDQ